MCPSPGDPPRKLAYVKAVQNAPVFFLHLFGIQSVPFSTSSVGEAATVDLVLVIDTSESMASDSCDQAPAGDVDPPCTPNYDPNDFNPAACNAANDCYPLRQAKDAAKSLIARLLPGYDQVAIVNYDFRAHHVFGLSSDIAAAMAAVDAVQVHDDAPAAKLEWSKPSPLDNLYKEFNPIFPDDRDGDGQDADPGAPCTDLIDYRTGAAGKDLWDDITGEPCDDDALLDAYDWNGNGDYSDDGSVPISSFEQTSQVSTCIGCGLHQATQVLRAGGRPDSVWVTVFLSDGIANLSDTHATNSDIPAGFLYGFCGDDPANSFWESYCIDHNSGSSSGRYCIDDDASECPPGTTHTTQSGPYSVEDYAFDITDEAALLFSSNSNEPKGEDMVIYSVGLDAARVGAGILRYMANLGDDGDRTTDMCSGIPPTSNCGNYYYAPTGAYLDQIFESIAARIFTKISR
ncbi:MAG: vWA domain-containing protein, partial [Anaerolineales bacterium]